MRVRELRELLDEVGDDDLQVYLQITALRDPSGETQTFTAPVGGVYTGELSGGAGGRVVVLE